MTYIFGVTDEGWYSRQIYPKWDAKTCTLTLKFEFNPQFSVGAYQYGCINGRHYIKKRDLPLVKGMGGNLIYFLPSEKRYRGAYWAKEISIYPPTPPKEVESKIVFQLHDRKLSLKEAILLKRIIYSLEDGVGVMVNHTDCTWSVSPPYQKFSSEKKTVQPIADFHQFVHKYWRALEVLGPLPSYPSLEFLKEIYDHWGERSIPLSQDVATGLEILAGDD